MSQYIGNGENVGYGAAGASKSKRVFRGLTAKSLTAREDIDLNNFTLRQRARYLYMSAPIARSAIMINRTNVVGSGLQLKCRVDGEILGLDQDQARAWERKTEAEFRLWAENKNSCDATGMNDFNGLQQLAFISWLINGDSPTLIKRTETDLNKPYSLRLHVMESDRISTPTETALDGFSAYQPLGETTEGNKIFDGVEIDKSGKVVAYHIATQNQLTGFFNADTTWQRVLAYGKETGLPNILFVMNSERAEQYRGVSFLAPVIEAILQIKRFTESELTAAVVSSFFTVFVTSEQPANMNPMDEALPGDRSDSVNHNDNEYQMGPGSINYMEPNEKIEIAESKRPNPSFDGFVKSLATQIGAAIGVPVDLLLLEFNASYSASRAALLEAWKSFRTFRAWFTNDFCKPTYELFLSEAIALGRIEARGFFNNPLKRLAWLGSEWVGPSQGQIDPVKEVNAYDKAVSKGWLTNEAATAGLNGGDWYANMDQLEHENERINKVFNLEESNGNA